MTLAQTPSGKAALRVEQALQLLPDVEDLAPLRRYVISLGSGSGNWAGAEPNRTMGKRTLDPKELRARVPQVLARVTDRVHALYEAAVDALECERSGDFSQAVRSLVRAGRCEERMGRYSQAQAWYKQALGVAGQLRDRQPEMEVLCDLGRLEAARGYLDEAARAYQRSLALAEGEGDDEHAAAACNGLGDVLFTQAHWLGAEAWYFRGLQYVPNTSTLVGTLTLALATTALRRGQLGESAGWLQRAEDAFTAQRDEGGLVRAIVVRGQIEAAQGRTNDVITSYREALKRLPQNGDDGLLEITVRMRLAELYVTLGRLPDGEDEARCAEELAITHHQPRLLARVYILMGKLRGRQGDENGFIFFEQAIALCRGAEPAQRVEADVYREYAAFRVVFGEVGEARAYLERARDLLEPFGDDAALDRVDSALRNLA
jgi:tetratricopeptide (TPR) repeat protein